MSTPSARFLIEFPADTSGISQSKNALDTLKTSIERDSKALKEMSDSMQRLRGTAEVIRWEALPKDISKAQNEVAKFAAKFEKLKADFAKAPDSRKEGLFAAALQNQGELNRATDRLAALRGERDKLGKSEPVRLFEDLKAGSEKLKQSLGQSQTSFSRLGGTMGDSAGDASKTAAAFKDLASGAEAAGLPTSGLVSKFGSLKTLGVAGLVAAVAVAVVALAVAFAAAVVRATAFAISVSDAARSTRLLREAAAGSATAADGLYQSTLRVEAKTNAQRETVAELVNEYARLKFSLGAIESATSAVTIATQTMGAQAGSTIKGLIDRGVDTKRFWLNALDLKGTGLTLRGVATQLAKQMGIAVGAAEAALREGRVKLEDGVRALGAAVEASPMGEIARKQALSLTTQFDRAKRNLANLFSGLNVDPFLEKLSGPLALLHETNDVGKALKHALTALFQPLVDSAGGSMPVLEGFIYGATIAIQKLVITALKAAVWLKETFGGSSLLNGIDAFQIGVDLGSAALNVFIGGLIVLAAAVATVITILGAIPAVIATVIGFFIRAGTAIWSGIVGAINLVAEQGPGAALDAAGGIITGLVNGIIEGAPKVAKALLDLAKSGLKAFKSALGIASPSKVFKAEAKWIGTGVAAAVDESRPTVARSLSGLADPSDLNAQGAAASIANNTSSQDRSINLVVNYSGGGTRSDARRFGQWLVDELETMTLAKGLST